MKTSNKYLIIGGTVVMLIIGLYLWFTVKKVTAATTGQAVIPSEPGSSTKMDETANNVGSSPSPAAVKTGSSQESSSASSSSWLDWILGNGSNPTPAQGQYNTSSTNVAVFPLKNGSTGTEVKNLQTWLNNHVILPFAFLNVDGKFGPLTLSALKRTLGFSEVSEAWYNVNILNKAT